MTRDPVGATLAASSVALSAGGLAAVAHGHPAWGLAGMVTWLVVAGVAWTMSGDQ